MADTDTSDSKIYAGTFCEVENSELRRWRGRVYNKTGAMVGVQCPIERDIVHAGSSMALWIKVIDLHYTDDVGFALWSISSDTDDAFVGYNAWRTSTGSGTFVQTLSYPALPAYSASSYYAIEGGIPAAYSGNWSSLIAYGTTEY
jgi:hypothetical protein